MTATSPASQVGMEGEARNETLIERLTAFDGGHQRDAYALIDEAAQAIRDLEAENARLRSAPIPAVQSGAVAWTNEENLASIARGCGAATMWPNQHSPDSIPLYLAAPQSEPLPGGVGEREKVARIIDPRGAETLDRMLAEAMPKNRQYILDKWLGPDVFAKADAILAHLSGKEQG